MGMNSLGRLFLAKGLRVFVFGVVSVLTPVYLEVLGYSILAVYVGIGAMIAGSAFSNIILVRYESHFGRMQFLMLFSAFMVAAGVILFSTASYDAILIALFIGNVSTTGTEAGSFQSVEVGILPSLLPAEKQNRGFGIYNLIGYSASSVGAFAASAPYYFHNDLFIFRSLYLFYGLVGVLLLILYRNLKGSEALISRDGDKAIREISPAARSEITRLSALFSIDAFGGGFVSQSLLVTWFSIVYGISLGGLGVIFLMVNIITAISTLGASYLADKIGNLRTMVYTHLTSNVFLIFIPLAGSLVGSLFFLFARQSISQMDVPTRQAFMAGVFSDKERVSAFATTNTYRIVSSVFGSPLSGILVGSGLVSIPLFLAGSSKILYDALIFSGYRKRTR
jgi:predicted MFS family arabinose efflux permease